jgi:hypothetical protein
LQFAKTLPFTANQIQIARAARSLAQLDLKDNRESAVSVIRNLIDLYAGIRKQEAFTAGILNILDKYKDRAASFLRSSIR